jgi:hypothetical protein
MRRSLLVFLMCLVPFQAVWSAGHALHGHLDHATAHSHDHDHDNHDAGDADFPLMNDAPAPHGDDARHGSHGHAAFSFLLAESPHCLTIAPALQPPPAPPAAFTSHIPPLPDPPPALRI